MQCLRALTNSSVAAGSLIFATLGAHASRHTAYGRVVAQGGSSSLEAPTPVESRTLGSQFRQSFGYAVEGWKDHWGLDASLSFIRPDYSSTRLMDQDGRSFLLSSTDDTTIEASAGLELNWQAQALLVSLRADLPLSPSPYRMSSQGIFVRRSFFNDTTRVGARMGLFQLSQPKSYYSDLNFQTQARPSHVNAYEAILSFEQVLSERWKVELDAAQGQRIEDRPPYWGLKLSQAYAFNDRLFAKSWFEARSELRASPLKNERGYFDRKVAGLELSYEVVYESLLSASYDLQVENERDPRRSSALRVGSDHYGLSFRSRQGRVDFEIGGGLRLASDQTRVWDATGGLRWDL